MLPYVYMSMFFYSHLLMVFLINSFKVNTGVTMNLQWFFFLFSIFLFTFHSYMYTHLHASIYVHVNFCVKHLLMVFLFNSFKVNTGFTINLQWFFSFLYFSFHHPFIHVQTCTYFHTCTCQFFLLFTFIRGIFIKQF